MGGGGGWIVGTGMTYNNRDHAPSPLNNYLGQSLCLIWKEGNVIVNTCGIYVTDTSDSMHHILQHSSIVCHQFATMATGTDPENVWLTCLYVHR